MQSPDNHALIAWNVSHSCFDVLGRYFSRGGCELALEAWKNRPSMSDWDLEIVSIAELKRLEAIA